MTRDRAGRRRELRGGQRPVGVTGSAGIVAVVDEVVSRCVTHGGGYELRVQRPRSDGGVLEIAIPAARIRVA